MHIIVIRAGIGGLTTAVALRRKQHTVSIYEQAPEPRAAGAGITLWANAVHALDHIGAGDVLQSGIAAAENAIRRWDGLPLSIMDPTTLAARYGNPTLGIHRADLMTALLDLCDADIHYGKRLERYDQTDDAVTLQFTDGTVATADLLVGADGIHSVVRRQMYPTSTPVYRGYAAWRGVCSFDYDRVNNMWGESWGRGSRFGLIPLSEGRVYWFATENRPASSPPDDHKGRLQHLFCDWHAPIPAVLDATPSDAVLYNDVFDIEPLTTWVDGRIVLLGDAAHAMTPNMGQGACQAIEDGVALADALTGAAHVSEQLLSYEARRQQRANAVLSQSRRIGQLGQITNPALCWLRDQAVRLTPASITLRQLDTVLRPA
ncbi:MAG: FAD-dependent monooxygenase [Chloroflexota bacterium]